MVNSAIERRPHFFGGGLRGELLASLFSRQREIRRERCETEEQNREHAEVQRAVFECPKHRLRAESGAETVFNLMPLAVDGFQRDVHIRRDFVGVEAISEVKLHEETISFTEALDGRIEHGFTLFPECVLEGGIRRVFGGQSMVKFAGRNLTGRPTKTIPGDILRNHGDPRAELAPLLRVPCAELGHIPPRQFKQEISVHLFGLHPRSRVGEARGDVVNAPVDEPVEALMKFAPRDPLADEQAGAEFLVGPVGGGEVVHSVHRSRLLRFGLSLSSARASD